MKNNKLANEVLDRLVDFTSDLLELGYSINETLKYSLGFLYNEKERTHLSSEDYIEIEANYLENMLTFSTIKTS